MKRIFMIFVILLSSGIVYAKNCHVDTFCENSYMAQNEAYYKDAELLKNTITDQQEPIVNNFPSKNRDVSIGAVDITGIITSKPYINAHKIREAVNKTIYVYEDNKGFYRILHFTEPIKLTCKA